ncbi:MAG: hypothetical protein KDA93_25770 [Planctomycetaceae bacterium]|nr:hypothetical protein [Planctomycetaceae bacterium]
MRDKSSGLWHAVGVTVIADTHRLISQLTQRGFTEQQAEVMIEVAQELDLSELATRRDITDLQHQLEKLELRLTINLGSLMAAGIGVLALLKYFG